MMLKLYSFPLTDSLNANIWFNYSSEVDPINLHILISCILTILLA